MDDMRPDDIALLIELGLFSMGVFAAIDKKRELSLVLMIAVLLTIILK
jgi:hypothetical protein